MWDPKLEEADGALYERIAAALERDVRAGKLTNGTRLPTLKELSLRLGVTPGTINRAYELAQRRGLVEGEVGRGTFVRAASAAASARAEGMPTPLAGAAPAGAASASGSDGGEWMDLSIVKSNAQIQEPFMRAVLTELSASPILGEMLEYTPDGGKPLHRQAGAAWMEGAGLPARAEQVVLTAGAQHGLWVAINALTQPGDLVLCESLCYPGVASVVYGLGRRLKGVRMDGEGMDPAQLREACRQERPAMVICIATCQNPTAGVMSVARRAAIADIAREFDVTLVDDDLYGFLAETPMPPLATFAPERTLYLTSLSKSVSSSVRLGYLHCPPAWLARLVACVRSTVWMVSPLAAQLATQLITSGQAAQVAALQKEEARARQLIARELLGAFDYRALPSSYHIWLKLPSGWSGGDQFVTLARGHQIILAGGDAFSMNRDGEGRQYVRINLMGGTREQIRFTLTKLAGLLNMADVAWL